MRNFYNLEGHTSCMWLCDKPGTVQEIFDSQEADRQSMAVWIGSIQSQVFTMTEAGINIDTILTLRMGFPLTMTSSSSISIPP
jgi:hypothetical protein